MLCLKQEGGIVVNNEMDASKFKHSDSVYFKEFENILSKIAFCYNLLRADNITVPLNDENVIRDILVKNYINNPEIKRSIELEYFILPEVYENNSSGRTDMRIFGPNTIYNQDEYYIIECKRLDNKNCQGTSGLNAKYIKNGIHRFTSEFYSSFYKTNAMIGFIVEAMDIHANIENINFLLENNFSDINTTSYIEPENFIKDFEYQYRSNHQTQDGKSIKLYHLMFDFS